MTKKILVVYSNRAEEGMLKPIMKRIETDKDLDFIELDFQEELVILGKYIKESSLEDLGKIYAFVEGVINVSKPDMAIVGFDRQEMIFSTLAIFHNNIHPIIHLYAGDCDPNVPVFDEAHRFAISVYADVHLCTTEGACQRMIELRNLMGKDLKHIYKIPPTNLDDLEFDNYLVPEKSYDLILLHPCTSKPSLIPEDIVMTIREIMKKQNQIIFLNPNGDEGSEIIDGEWKNMQDIKPERVIYYDKGVPRSQFLALLRDCSRFISNSSVTIYEAPYFLEPEQIVHIGLRNKNRERLSKEELIQGGSDKVIEILRRL